MSLENTEITEHSRRSHPEGKSILEALLFVSNEPVSVAYLSKILELQEQEVRSMLDELAREYDERSGGLVIAEIAEGYQMFTRPDLGSWIRKFNTLSVSHRLSQPALEALSIIAYKQPITKVEIDQLRGVNSEGALKSVLDKRLIKIVGRKEAPGRPFLYGTTREFLQYFGLKNLGDLPPINDSLNHEAA